MKKQIRQSRGYRLIFTTIFIFILFTGNAQEEKVTYNSYGNDFTVLGTISNEKIFDMYSYMETEDSLQLTMKANVNAVCKAKGCWMKLALIDNEEVMVKFKDYSFFVPKDIEGKEVIIQGKAFVNLVSVEEQRHYAKDAGKSKEYITSITKPKKTYSFLADGVKIKE
ncbi:DUF4920 domain-containing protein [Ascidiimonas sp. W6]|uniref:DUF4920 domain-containing protein n=1 Tax=Ascidiimonas meishanensis TaxID=3128903 RepID=UPI0030EB5C56